MPTIAAVNPRWSFEADGALRCELNGRVALPDKPVELVTHGKRVIMRISFPADDGKAAYVKGPEVQWPIFKRDVRDKSLKIPGQDTRGTDLPDILVNGVSWVPSQRTAYRYDGFFHVLYAPQKGVRATRTLFPSIEQRMALQAWTLENMLSEPLKIQVPSVQAILWRRKAVTDQDWLVEYRVTGVAQQTLQPGESVQFAVAYTARAAADPPLVIDLAREKQAHADRVRYALSHLKLVTPDALLNHTFEWAKVRILLSNIETKAGLTSTTGSMAYYCGFWANDNAEYASPLVPLLGSADLEEGIDTMYRVWLKDIAQYGLQDKQITGSFESYNLKPYQRGRGDEAMILYGLSRYLLTLADPTRAEEMWPLIVRCVDYLKMNLNSAGVIASRTDELEGRLPTGQANLSTSALAYGGLQVAARLGRALGKTPQADQFDQFAQGLAQSIETCFGAPVQGYETYRYYAGGDLLRGWISLPLVVGLKPRQTGTLDALFSDKLWLEKPETLEVNLKAVSTESSTKWARETYYALLAAFKSGRTDLALAKTRIVLTSHMLGHGGPFADEDDIDLLSPSVLYARVITEGLFGIEPLSFHSFQWTPRLPESWPMMQLNAIQLLGRQLDLQVSRQGADILVRVLEHGKELMSQTGKQGSVFEVKLTASRPVRR
ncbi:MAG: hypothetical protein WCO56_18025 [Verrucomicrobiota bacterium]